MNTDDFIDYVVNLMLSALLAGTEEKNEQLRKEHEKVKNKLLFKEYKENLK